MWTGWDYLGEAGLGSWSYDSNAGINKAYPELLAGTGAIDILGLPGAPAFLAQAVWGQLNAPAIAVRPLDRAGQRTQTTPWRSSDAIASWSWAGYDGTTAQIEVYTADDEVELLLNGRSLGRKPAGQAAGFVTRFETPYRPGTLTAVGYRGNQETARSQLHSASSPRLTLRPERARSSGDENFWFVWIELADDHGVVDTGSHDELKIEVHGEATLAALGNAAPATTESFTDTTHDTYYGRAMAMVRGPIDAQNVQLTARSRRHGDVSIQLTSPSADKPARTNGARSLRDADTAGALR